VRNASALGDSSPEERRLLDGQSPPSAVCAERALPVPPAHLVE
jgi:hypothetical protein